MGVAQVAQAVEAANVAKAKEAARAAQAQAAQVRMGQITDAVQAQIAQLSHAQVGPDGLLQLPTGALPQLAVPPSLVPNIGALGTPIVPAVIAGQKDATIPMVVPS